MSLSQTLRGYREHGGDIAQLYASCAIYTSIPRTLLATLEKKTEVIYSPSLSVAPSPWSWSLDSTPTASRPAAASAQTSVHGTHSLVWGECGELDPSPTTLYPALFPLSPLLP